jgi:hypothetical integral membrane protein (TIGR02206 family)
VGFLLLSLGKFVGLGYDYSVLPDTSTKALIRMEQFFAKDYLGDSFELFGLPHIIAMSVITLVNVVIICFGQRLSSRWRVVVRYVLAFFLIFAETAWHVWNLATAQWTIQKMLPLHLCSVLVWLSAVMALTKNYRIYEFAYLLGIAGASQAIITPDAGQYGFPHFRFFQVFVSHGSIVTSAIFMTVVEGYRPFPKSILRVAVIGNLYVLFVAVVNALIGSNYLFIARKPETASLLDVLPPWPWYILYIEGIGLVMILLLYLPFAIRDWRAKRVATS